MSTKLKCLLLDDELPGLAYLKMLCEQIPNVEIVKAFNDPEKFIDSLNTLEYDLCILDIEMPKLNGIEVAQRIKDKPVIFTTAYKDYAAEAFDVNAIDYIRKPIQKERLEKAIAKATIVVSSMPAQKQYAQFNTDKGKTLLMFDEILYITSSDTDKRDKIVYLTTEQRLTLKNISYEQLLSILPSDRFCRLNKKDVIAMNVVRTYTHDEVTTAILTKEKEALKFPLNDTFRTEFKSRLA